MNVRVDGLAVVLGPLLGDARIVAAVLVDVDSGMVLDAWSAAGGPAAPPDLELVGAQHAEVVRCALALLREWPGHDGAGSNTAGPGGDTCEIVLGADGGVRHLVRSVPDPYGDRLALAVVVDGPQRVLDRVRKRLRSVAVDALTAGPSVTRRPVRGAWSFAMPTPDMSPGPPAPEQPAGPGEPPTGPLRTVEVAAVPVLAPAPAAVPAVGVVPAFPVGTAVDDGRDTDRRPSPPVALPAPPRQRDR